MRKGLGQFVMLVISGDRFRRAVRSLGTLPCKSNFIPPSLCSLSPSLSLSQLELRPLGLGGEGVLPDLFLEQGSIRESGFSLFLWMPFTATPSTPFDLLKQAHFPLPHASMPIVV